MFVCCLTRGENDRKTTWKYQFQRRTLINCKPRAAFLIVSFYIEHLSKVIVYLSWVCACAFWCDVYSRAVYYGFTAVVKINPNRKLPGKMWANERLVRSETSGKQHNIRIGLIDCFSASRLKSTPKPHRPVEFSLWSHLFALPTAVDDLSFICQNVRRLGTLISPSYVCWFRMPPFLTSLIVVIN